ncbi:MAG TPA: hypothetical protein VL651_05050 [Bacteroidia bacterium]|nr:hypothetical protein [Bacteroidia bacterium]
MTRSEFLNINDQPCRIKLRSGNEVFGVIWEKNQPGGAQYYFSTLNERYNRLNAIGMLVQLEDIVGAEILSNSGSLVG